MKDQIEEVEDLEEIEEAEEIEGDQDIEADGDQDAEPPEDTTDPSVEAEARKWGWKPKAEWRGNTEGWVPAEKFVNLPSTDNKRLRADVREKEAAFNERMERLERANKAAMDRALEVQKQAHQRQLDAIRQQKRAAADSADIKEYDRLEAREAEIQKAAPVAPSEPTTPQGPPPELLEYGKSEDGQWLNNPALVAEARQLIDSSKIALQMQPMDQVRWAKEQVRGRYPGMFPQVEDKPAPRSRVDGGGLAGRKASVANKLPPEARQAAKEFVEQGLFKSVDDYAKTYFEQEA